MSLFTPEARAATIARASRGIDRMEHRPIRGLRSRNIHETKTENDSGAPFLPLRTMGEAMADIREYEHAHGLKPRNLAPLMRRGLHVVADNA